MSVSNGSTVELNRIPTKNDSKCSDKCYIIFNPCPAEPGYTLPLQTV